MRNTYRVCTERGIGLTDILDKVKCQPSKVLDIFDIQHEYYNDPTTMTITDIVNQIFSENTPKPKVEVKLTRTWLSA